MCLSLITLHFLLKLTIFVFVCWFRRELEQKSVISNQEIHENLNVETQPELLYDLCGTIDHSGNLYQGHYVSNVKIDNKWYHCNDAFISESNQEAVLSSREVYMMFYIRR